MRITFLGHQGWHFEEHGRGFLLDPIRESIGNGAVQLPVWPRRRLDFQKFEPLDAVIVSHEHADHFSMDTLAALPKRCLIYIPDLASSAMATIIAEMDFEVRRFSALQPFIIAGMQVTALPGLYNLLEPDTYALLVKDESGASFLTSIDTVPHPDVIAWLAAQCPARTLDNLTNNFLEPRHALVRDPTSCRKSRALVASDATEFVRNFAPHRAVISGQGWCYDDDKTDFNRSFFSADNQWLTGVMRELAPHVEWFEGLPGMRFTLRGEQCFVDQSLAVDPSRFTNREFDENSVRIVEPYPPWSGTKTMSVPRFDKVREFILGEYGKALGAHAPKLMERLYYLKFQAAAILGRSPATVGVALALILRNGASCAVFEFDYGALRFREVTLSHALDYAVGVEMWASDFERMLRAEEESFTIYETAVRPWSTVPDILDERMLNELFLWFTPRFRPDEFLAAYRSRVAALKSVHTHVGDVERSASQATGLHA